MSSNMTVDWKTESSKDFQKFWKKYSCNYRLDGQK